MPSLADNTKGCRILLAVVLVALPFADGFCPYSHDVYAVSGNAGTPSRLFSALTGPKLSSTEAPPSTESFDWEASWYPVAPLSQLEGNNDAGRAADMPQACTILGRKIVVWKSGINKDNGTSIWSALDDTCPHRRTTLSTGKVVDGDNSCTKRLQCRMHGWQFDSDGSCAKVPMMEGNLTASNRRALGTRSYHTKTAGGMLWAFLDPTVRHDDLPDLPSNAAIPEHELRDKFWVHSFLVSPVSYESQIENSFDPSHAPFVHEVIGKAGSFGSYSPDNALPMKRYEVLEDIDARSGFVVEHTPYQTSDNADAVTTRRFIPPCSQITTAPNGPETRLQFVPASKRETRVTFSFGIPKPRNVIVRRIMALALKNDFLHTMTEISEGRRRFSDQDRIIMQGQDDRKMIDGMPWADLKPTKSDVGVATYQRWMTKFGGGGPFSNVAATPNAGALSMWESHGQHCSRCKRTLKGLVTLEKRAAKASRASLALGAFAGFASLILKKAKDSLVSLCALSCLFLLVASFAARCLATWSSNIQGNMLATDVTKREIQEVYAY